MADLPTATPGVASPGPPWTTLPQPHCGAGGQELGSWSSPLPISRHSQVISLRGSPPWTVKLSNMALRAGAGQGRVFQYSIPTKATGSCWSSIKKKKDQMNPFNQSSSPQANTHSVIFYCKLKITVLICSEHLFHSLSLSLPLTCPEGNSCNAVVPTSSFTCAYCFSDTSPGREHSCQQDRTDLTLTPSPHPALLPPTAGRRRAGRNPRPAMPSYKTSPLIADIAILPHSEDKHNPFFQKGHPLLTSPSLRYPVSTCVTSVAVGSCNGNDSKASKETPGEAGCLSPGLVWSLRLPARNQVPSPGLSLLRLWQMKYTTATPNARLLCTV